MVHRDMPSEESLKRRLAELVAADTQNPTGDERLLVDKLAAELRLLGADDVEIFGAGSHHAVLARFGASPRVLVNVHLDTVPISAGWSTSPFALVERDGDLYGLGAADTKGAIAAVLEALAQRAAAGRRPRGTAVLFSGDEEVGGTVVRAFLASGRARGVERAIVCEPTGCRAGARHRGIVSVRAIAESPGGHSSFADSLPAPLVVLSRAALALDRWGREHREAGPPQYRGLCLNVGSMNGGVAFNVVPSRAELVASFRPWPGADAVALLREAEASARAGAAPDPIDWKVDLASAPFETRDLAAFEPLLGASARAPADLGFWTEAALFSAAGIDAIVFGPGDIAKAHAPDEHVSLSDLAAARDTFAGGLP
jgi:acetylornithine deacetylase